MNKKQGTAYAAITLNLLYKMKCKITPEVLAEEMNLIYDLYEPNEIETEYENYLKSNRTIIRKNKSRIGIYIINFYDSAKEQNRTLEEFCKKHRMNATKIFISPPGENQEKFYELIRDIRNMEFDVLLLTGFTLLGISKEEYATLVRICRTNNVNIIEV